jgi:hypothetical protein
MAGMGRCCMESQLQEWILEEKDRMVLRDRMDHTVIFHQGRIYVQRMIMPRHPGRGWPHTGQLSSSCVSINGGIVVVLTSLVAVQMQSGVGFGCGFA